MTNKTTTPSPLLVVGLDRKVRHLIGKLLCKVAFHRYASKPILADLDTYWMQGGEECLRCRARKISFNEAAMLAKFAYERGKQRSETSFLAYGNGVKKVVALYGKEHTHKLVDDA